MCFKFRYSVRCFEDMESLGGVQVRYSFGETNLIVYSIITYSNRSSILCRNVISESGYVRTFLMNYTNRKGEALIFNEGYINILNYDNFTTAYPFL